MPNDASPTHLLPGHRPQGEVGAPVAYAALDLGTNNCRLLIGAPCGGGFRVLDSFSRIVRLGEGLHATGGLSDAAMDRALAALSIWYDDPSLGLEESQRLEDLLGQLAGTVIYSQQDLLLPPHVVAAGETLPAIAMQLRVSWQLLGKINGVDDPQRLMPGEHLKLIRGPFDAVVSVSRRRISLQLAGNFAGSFPVVVGRQFLARVGSSIPVAELRRGSGRDMQAAALAGADAAAKPAIVLADGLVIEAAEDPGMASDTSPATSLVVSVRDLAELLDILGPGSNVLIRQ